MARSWNRFMRGLTAKAEKAGPAHVATLAALRAHYARLGHELAKERKRLDVSQASLAKITGVDQAEISRIEHDQVDPRMGTYVRLLAGLGLGLRVERVRRAPSARSVRGSRSGKPRPSGAGAKTQGR